MRTESIRLMLSDVVRGLLENARGAKDDAARLGTDNDKGRQYAYYQVVSLLKQQAEAFGLERASIGLDGVDPERDILAGG